MSELSTNEKHELRKYERTIEEGLSRFVAVGHALYEIRTKKLFRGHYDSFKEYLDDRWGMSQANASRLIKGSEVATRIPEIKNEGQAREVAKVPYTDQKSVFDRAKEIAVNRGSGVTAQIINEAAAEPSRMTARPEGSIETWTMEGLNDLWQMADDTATELRHISRKIASDPQGCWFNSQLATVEQKIKDIFTCLRFARPHAPCSECAGGLKKPCEVCKDRGWLPESVHSALVAKKNRENNSQALDM